MINRENPWQALAHAIVRNAAEEYLAVLKQLKKDPDNVIAQNNRDDLDVFFRSGWLMALTKLNGKYIMKRLEEEFEREEQRQERRRL